MSTIPILVDDTPQQTPLEPVLGGGGGGPKIAEVDTSRIKGALQKLTGDISEMLTDLKSVGDFKLKTVAITVEINAEGKIFLVGKAGAKGGVTLTFEA